MIGTLFTGALGFASGFACGVVYGTKRTKPWKDLGDTVSELTVWVRQLVRTAKKPVEATDETPGTDGEAPPA